jgi:two-component system NarL family response regulator
MTTQPTLCGLVLADASPILLEGLLRKFSAEPGFHVLCCCATGAETLRAVLEHGADVLILDLRIARTTAFEVLKELKARQASCRVILLADRVSKDEVADAARFGAKGVAFKSVSRDHLVHCVRTVHENDSWPEGGTSTSLSADETRSRLSLRQHEIAELVARGYSNAEIAERLSIGEGTVKGHLHLLYKKLGLSGRVALALYATRGIFLRRPPRSAA